MVNLNVLLTEKVPVQAMGWDVLAIATLNLS